MGRGLAVVLLVLAATATGAITRPARASTAREDHLRAEIAQLLNGERANRGLRQLPADAGLQQRAQAWAERNRSAGCEPPADCHSPDAEAEILAWAWPDTKTGAVVVAWMQSDTHRDILLHSQATAIGVGFACAADGKVHIAVQFAGIRKPVPPTPGGSPATAAQAGSACTGAAAALSETAPPPTTPPPSTPPTAPATTTHPSTPATAPPNSPRAAERVLPRAAPPTTAVAAPIAPAPPDVNSTTTQPPAVVLSANTPEVSALAGDETVALRVAGPGAGGRTEAAWIAMVVVVVFLSVLRVGFQLRDNALARSEESVRGRGL